MKKYNLVIKESVQYIEKGEFPTLTIGNRGVSRFKLLCKKQIVLDDTPFTFMINHETNKYKEVTTFTQQEIDKLPYGFVKSFDLIELAEERYYIKMPHTSGKVLNEDLRDGEVTFAGPYETSNFKTRFTLEYIEETYPEYKQFAVTAEEEE